ncbi:MAG: BNR-4 repeat-containing protein [Candidatus Saccharibacteria bacterium]|nr:BNR-4 repeat-containing protein [Candidatus Saccharibacteria bacterium]
MSISNLRNGGAGSGPQCWTAPDGTEYTVVIMNDWNALACRRAPGQAWETFDLSTISGNPLGLPVGSGDAHNRLAICRDSSGYIHIVGNTHGEQVMHYIKSNQPDSIAGGFSSAAGLIDLTPSFEGVDPANAVRGTYDTFLPFTNGVIAWLRGQRDQQSVLGRDSVCYVLKPGETNWQPWDGVGDLIKCDNTENNGDPERAYCHAVTVHNDTLWVSGVWQWDAVESGEPEVDEGQDTRREPFMIKSDDFSTAIMNNNIPTFTSVSGQTVIMPILEPESKAVTDCTIPNTLDPSLLGGNLGFDSNDNIHFTESGYVNGRHHWWDGSAWQQEDDSELFVPFIGLVQAKGQLHHYKTSGGKLKITNLETNDFFYLGYDVPGNFSPLPDPIALSNGVLKFSIPDGDAPQTYSFGTGTRLKIP